MKTKGIVSALVVLLVAGCADETANRFSSPEGGFSVLIPGRPKRESKTQSGNGLTLTTHVFRSNLGTKSAYVVAWTDLPSTLNVLMDPDNAIKIMRDSQLKLVNGSLISERRIKLKGNPGIEFDYSVPPGPGRPDGVGRSRMYIVGQRVYEVTLVGDEERARSVASDNFLKSFTLAPGA